MRSPWFLGGSTVDPDVTDTRSGASGGSRQEIPSHRRRHWTGLSMSAWTARLSGPGSPGGSEPRGGADPLRRPQPGIGSDCGGREGCLCAPHAGAVHSAPVQEELIRQRIKEIKGRGGHPLRSTALHRERRCASGQRSRRPVLICSSSRRPWCRQSTSALKDEGSLDLEALCRDMGVPVVIGNCVALGVALRLMRAGAAGVAGGHRSGSRLHIARCSGRGHPSRPRRWPTAASRPPRLRAGERPPCADRAGGWWHRHREATSASASPAEPMR